MESKKYDQSEYNRRWEEKNRERRRYLSYRGSAKSFIRNHASLEDLKELEKLIEEKKKSFQNNWKIFVKSVDVVIPAHAV